MIMFLKGNKFLWYAAGLHFECFQCGRCCSGPAEGYIWVSGPEIRLIAGHLNMSAGELKKKSSNVLVCDTPSSKTFILATACS